MGDFFQIRNSGKGDPEILIYESIGNNGYGDGLSAQRFVEAFKALNNPKQVVLRINSAGGSVFDGLAILNFLKGSGTKIIVHVDGLAASIASVIAMAGHSVRIPENAYIMVHDPAAIVLGGADDMRDMAALLDKLRAGIVTAYQEKTRLPRSRIEQLMADETWMDGKEAKALGFADEVTAAVKVAASADLSQFNRVPAALRATATSPATMKLSAGAGSHQLDRAEASMAQAEGFKCLVGRSPEAATDWGTRAWQASPEIRAEFGTEAGFLAFVRGTAAGRIAIHKGSVINGRTDK